MHCLVWHCYGRQGLAWPAWSLIACKMGETFVMTAAQSHLAVLIKTDYMVQVIMLNAAASLSTVAGSGREGTRGREPGTPGELGVSPEGRQARAWVTPK